MKRSERDRSVRIYCLLGPKFSVSFYLSLVGWGVWNCQDTAEQGVKDKEQKKGSIMHAVIGTWDDALFFVEFAEQISSCSICD